MHAFTSRHSNLADEVYHLVRIGFCSTLMHINVILPITVVYCGEPFGNEIKNNETKLKFIFFKGIISDFMKSFNCLINN